MRGPSNDLIRGLPALSFLSAGAEDITGRAPFAGRLLACAPPFLSGDGGGSRSFVYSPRAGGQHLLQPHDSQKLHPEARFRSPEQSGQLPACPPAAAAPAESRGAGKS